MPDGLQSYRFKTKALALKSCSLSFSMIICLRLFWWTLASLPSLWLLVLEAVLPVEAIYISGCKWSVATTYLVTGAARDSQTPRYKPAVKASTTWNKWLLTGKPSSFFSLSWEQTYFPVWVLFFYLSGCGSLLIIRIIRSIIYYSLLLIFYPHYTSNGKLDTWHCSWKASHQINFC